MTKVLMTTIRAALLTAAVAVLAGFVSSPASAQKGYERSMSPEEFKNLIAHPKTKADHERVAQYYDEQAWNYEAGAKLHQELAAFYKRNPDRALSKNPGSNGTYEHCDSLSKELQMAAEDARGLAAEQRELAKEAKK